VRVGDELERVDVLVLLHQLQVDETVEAGGSGKAATRGLEQTGGQLVLAVGDPRYSASMKSYRLEDCPVARTLDLIGERWTILVLRDLLLQGPRRFQDFQESLTGLAPNTLSARLKALEESGLVTRKQYSDHPPRLEYHLTERGKSLGPVVKALRDWGSRHTP
jgi:DNA-binding HxlR family transcriptional regulator